MTARPGVQRALVAEVQVLGMAVWFSASAVVPAPREAALNLADRVRAPLLMAASAALAAACTGVFAVAVDSLAGAVPLRFLTGVFLAGVYPVGMKLTASWAPPARRGLAFGVMIGALTLGSALPHLIGGLGGGRRGRRPAQGRTFRYSSRLIDGPDEYTDPPS